MRSWLEIFACNGFDNLHDSLNQVPMNKGLSISQALSVAYLIILMLVFGIKEKYSSLVERLVQLVILNHKHYNSHDISL